MVQPPCIFTSGTHTHTHTHAPTYMHTHAYTLTLTHTCRHELHIPQSWLRARICKAYCGSVWKMCVHVNRPPKRGVSMPLHECRLGEWSAVSFSYRYKNILSHWSCKDCASLGFVGEWSSFGIIIYVNTKRYFASSTVKMFYY